MAQLIFNYGTVGAGKSIEILKVAYNYEEQGKKVLVLTSSTDDRYGVGKITSRIGESREADMVIPEEDLKEESNHLYNAINGYIEEEAIWCILIDEAQFLSKNQVLQLGELVDTLNIPVMAYGLKNDFQNNLFEGSKALLEQADKIKETKTMCGNPTCNSKATMNLRINNGSPVYAGSQIQIGGNESYIPVCRKHYHHSSWVR